MALGSLLKKRKCDDEFLKTNPPSLKTAYVIFLLPSYAEKKREKAQKKENIFRLLVTS